MRMGTAATTFQTGLERRLPVPIRRARMKGLQAPLQVCSALHSPAGSDRPAGFFRCLAAPAWRARMNTGGSVHRPCRLESPPRPVAPRRGFSFAALRDRLARQVAVLDILPDAERLAQDEHAVGGSQLPLLANTLLLPPPGNWRGFS